MRSMFFLGRGLSFNAISYLTRVFVFGLAGCFLTFMINLSSLGHVYDIFSDPMYSWTANSSLEARGGRIKLSSLFSFFAAIFIWGAATHAIWVVIKKRYEQKQLKENQDGVQFISSGASFSAFIAAQLLTASAQWVWWALACHFIYAPSRINLIIINTSIMAFMAAFFIIIMMSFEWRRYERAHPEIIHSEGSGQRGGLRAQRKRFALIAGAFALLFAASLVPPWSGEGMIGPYAEFKRAYNELLNRPDRGTSITQQSLSLMLTQFGALPKGHASVEPFLIANPQPATLPSSLDKGSWVIIIKALSKPECEALRAGYERERLSTQSPPRKAVFKNSGPVSPFLMDEQAHWGPKNSENPWFSELVIEPELSEEMENTSDAANPALSCYEKSKARLIF